MLFSTVKQTAPAGRGSVCLETEPRLAGAVQAGTAMAQRGGISMIRWALAATLFGVLWTFTPLADPHIRWCGFYWLTGHPCALCGMTRAMFALAKGHFAEAEHFNALAPLGFAMVFSLFWTGKIIGKLWTAGIAAFAVYGVCRIFVTQ